MPEYLAPGVYVEEVSFRAKSIEGVSTTTTGFIGPTRYGPLDLEPDVLTSLSDFEQVYGDRDQLEYTSGLVTHNYMWHAARAFFEEGGQRLYVTRVFRPQAGTYPPASFDNPAQSNNRYDDGHARAALGGQGDGGSLGFRARFPGAAGDMLVRLTLRTGQNILGGKPGQATVSGLQDGDVVAIRHLGSPPASPVGGSQFYVAESYYNVSTQAGSWRFHPAAASPPGGAAVELSSLSPATDPTVGDSVRVVTLTLTVTPNGGDGLSLVWAELPLDPNHERNGLPDSLFDQFAAEPSNLAQARTLPLVITRSHLADGVSVLNVLLSARPATPASPPQQARPSLAAALDDGASSDDDRSVTVALQGGNDGLRPGAGEYEGQARPDSDTKTGLYAFEDIDDISIVAAPGSTYLFDDSGYHADGQTIVNLLIGHAERMRYRIAVLDSGDRQTVAAVRATRGRIDSSYAALYYPWVRVLDPVTRTEIHLPPSGFVCGIYARNDVNRAVYKAPANEVVTLAIGFESLISKGQQDVLNPEGVNCFRYFEGRGYRLWGARTASSDPEWKYVNVRRYFAYVEHSIDRGTQWAVFEPNGPQLWANVRRTIQDFLFNEFQSGALLGDKPEQAYFVRCDRSTMTQNDLDNGRLVCLVGIAAIKPAEYVIFRIGQKTADATS